MLAGNFGAFTNQLYDPASTGGSFANTNLSRTPFPGNVIPVSRFSSMWNAIAANKPFLAPQAGVGSTTNTGPNGNIVASGTGNYFNLTNQFRVDHSFSSKLRAMLSYSTGNQHQPQNNVNITYAPYDQYQTLQYTVQRHAALSLTYTISPTFISETRVGIYRRTGNYNTLKGQDYTYALAKTVPGLPANVYLNPINFGLTQGTNGSSQLGVGTMRVSVNNTHQFNQDFTKVWGKHSFKFGYEYMYEDLISHDISNPRLSLTFGGTTGLQSNGSNIPNTGGISLADIMLGYVTSYSYNQQGQSNLPQDGNHSAYFQDDWRVLPNLTLNLGMRYNNESPGHSKFPGGLSVGSLTAPDNFYTSGSVPGVLTCPAGGCVGAWIHPKGNLWNRDNNNFQPRVGLAWSLGDKMVIRSGFGLNTMDWGLYTNQSEIGGPNFYNQSVSQPANVYTPLFNINSGVPAFQIPKPLADGSIPTSASSPSARPTINVIPANYHNPYTLNWNFTVQRAIHRDYMVELSYVGMHNVGLPGNYNYESRPWGTGIDANGNVIDLTQPQYLAYRNTWVNNTSGVNGTQAYKPYPNLGGVNYQCNCVRMIYHSGTIKLEKRLSHGLSFLTFMRAWQKGIQNAPGNLYQDDNLMRAVTGTTQKYRYVSSMTYQLPFGKGKKFMNRGGLLDQIFGGYSFAWNYSVWAPTPVGLGYSGGTYVNPATGVVGARQNYPGYEPDPGNDLYLIQVPTLRDGWQDIGNNRFVQNSQNPIVTNCGVTPILAGGATVGNLCEQVAPSFTRGNMPNNFVILQRIIGANASIYKEFPIKEKVRMEIRMDYYNPFKWFNWSGASTTMSPDQPGRVLHSRPQ